MMIGKEPPKVSVIIPIYGVEKFIVRCVESLFSQTLKGLEFIFIDDCTPDDSMSLLDSIIQEKQHCFAENNWNVRIEKMPTNSGLAAVRRQGLQMATGDYIVHCDSDDWVAPDIYEKMYTKAIKDNADIVVCDYYQDDGNGRKIIKKAVEFNLDDDFFKLALLQSVGSSVWNKLVKKSIAQNSQMIYARANMGEDYVLTIQNFYYAKRISYLEEPLYYYFYNENSITKSMTEEKIFLRFKQSIDNMKSVIEFVNSRGIENNYVEELDRIKYFKRDNLLPLLGDCKYYVIWKNTFPEINMRLLSNHYLTAKEKLKYVMRFCRILRR